MNHSPSEDTRVLLYTASAFHANSIVAALKDHGIDALALEETLMGALSPRSSKSMVVVHERDLTKAQFALDNIRRTAKELDWAEIDVGDHTSLTEQEEDSETIVNASLQHRPTPPLIYVLAILGVLMILIGMVAFVITLFA